MTTKITVNIEGADKLLDTAKSLQAETRAEYVEKKKDKKIAEEAAEELELQETATKEDNQKGAVADSEEDEKRPVGPKSRRCGHWIFTDHTFRSLCPSQDTAYSQTYRENIDYDMRSSDLDRFQISVGSGNGTSWATHVIEGGGSKPAFCPNVPGQLTSFIGYLHYIQVYEGAFGTVYSIPDGAVVVPYDPAIYLKNPTPGLCPDNFCWPLYFPDELNSGSGRSRKMVSIGVVDTTTNGTDLQEGNHFYVGMPVNNRTSIIAGKSTLHYTVYTTQRLDSPRPSELVLDPEDMNKYNVMFKVYYKYPGGQETGWQPITGYYWIMDPSDSTKILTKAEVAALVPYSSTSVLRGSEMVSEKWAFVVNHKRAREIAVPDKLGELIDKRAPDPAPYTYFPWFTWEYPMHSYYERDFSDDEFVLGYRNFTYQPDVHWWANPDAQCPGWAKNLFGIFETDKDNMPYDFFSVFVNKDYDILPIHYLQGLNPGAYDYIDKGMNDLKMYNHLGRGSWAADNNDSWDVGPITSNYGQIRLTAPDNSTGSWFRSISDIQSNPNISLSYGVPKYLFSWFWLTDQEQEDYIENYLQYIFGQRYYHSQNPSLIESQYDSGFYGTEISAVRQVLQNTPKNNRELKFIEYRKPEDDEYEDLLVDGVKWVSSGFTGSWTPYNIPEFDYNNDPFYTDPYLNASKAELFRKYKLKTKLSNNRLWPPSLIAGNSEPINPKENSEAKFKHPLYLGLAQMHYIANTAWDGDYTAQLLELGIPAEDLRP